MYVVFIFTLIIYFRCFYLDTSAFHNWEAKCQSFLFKEHPPPLTKDQPHPLREPRPPFIRVQPIQGGGAGGAEK